MTAKVLARGVRITRRKPWSAMYMKSFWTEPRAFQRALDVMFRIEERGGTIRDEFICGLIHFMACVYIIPVLPGVMNYPGGYDPEKVDSYVFVSGVTCDDACCLGGLLICFNDGAWQYCIGLRNEPALCYIARRAHRHLHEDVPAGERPGGARG
jgi:hypothetical protein